METKKVKDKNPCVTFWVVESTWKPALDKNWNKEYSIIPWWEWMLFDCVSQKKYITWENWILEIIEWIKNVAITKEEYEKLKKEHQKIMDNDYEWYDWDFPLCFHLESSSDISIYSKKQRSQIYYSWYWWEIGWSESYSDITVCFDNFSDKEEYYKTSEVLEVLEKWKEALERWNNPEEKKKMIEEFEKSNKN